MGVDTSLRSSGIGILDRCGSRFIPVYYGTIKNPPKRPLSDCLSFIGREIAGLIDRYEPAAIAIEGIFYAKNVKTMLILAHARGVVIERCNECHIPVDEYEPRRVKMAVAGFGGAQKPQIQKMVKTLLNLEEIPQNDAADALALAMTHLHNRTSILAQTSTPI